MRVLLLLDFWKFSNDNPFDIGILSLINSLKSSLFWFSVNCISFWYGKIGRDIWLSLLIDKYSGIFISLFKLLSWAKRILTNSGFNLISLLSFLIGISSSWGTVSEVK